MSVKSKNSFNHDVFKKSYVRLNLSSTNRIIYQRLLGFLLRNDRPFPYSAVKMAEITGFSLRTIFNSLNDLERYRLIERIGQGKNRRFKRGSILNKIISTVQNRAKTNQYKKSTTVQLVHQKSINRATGAYNKTSSFLKPSVCGNSKSSSSKNSEHTHNKNQYSSLGVHSPSSQSDNSHLRSRCLSDKSCLERFETKFADYDVTIEQLFEECYEHYKDKMTVRKFLKWIGWEKIENHAKREANSKKSNSEFVSKYQEYYTLAVSEPNRKKPILTFDEFMLSLEDKKEQG